MAKWDVAQYVDVINAKKLDAHNKEWLYIEVNAKDLLEECEAGVKNLNVCCKAILQTMLEGDYFVVEPKNRSKCAGTLTVRYYCDNLDPSRRTYAEVAKETK